MPEYSVILSDGIIPPGYGTLYIKTRSTTRVRGTVYATIYGYAANIHSIALCATLMENDQIRSKSNSVCLFIVVLIMT